MGQLTLAGVQYTVCEIEGMAFLIPAHLQKFERKLVPKLEKAIRLLKKKGWFEYVLMADMLTITVRSKHGKCGLVFGTSEENHCPIFMGDSGRLSAMTTAWLASIFVHEATHVFQQYYLSKQEK